MAISTVTSVGSTSSNESSTASSLAISGLASGMDWTTIVQELAQAERAPETQWEAQQTTIGTENAAYATITSDLTTLQTDAETLVDPSFFDSVTASSSNSTVATASVASGTPPGNYTFDISQLATAAQMNGTTLVSQVLDPGGDPSTVTVGSAGFATPVTAGTFTVNGAQVNIATTDSLQTVFDNIASATLAAGNQVTATYNASTDKITLASSNGSPIVLGSAADTSNFLQDAQLYNNNGGASDNTGTIASVSALGHVNTAATMNDADLKVPISNGGSGQGAFKINGVTFNYNASTDSLQDIIDNINASAAGVTASYDPINNRFVLDNATTGDVGISMKDVTGNFLAATGLSGGTLSHGQNLLYTMNGGTQQIVSQSNTIAPTSSGITGLSVSALSTGTATVNVSIDTATISTAIQKFVTDYSTAQSYIASEQAVTTAADGTVTPGTLTGDTTTNDVSTGLRSLVDSVENITGTSGAVTSLSDLGFESNGNNNTITLSNSTTLTSMLTTNLKDVAALFSDPTNGLATQVNAYITNTIGTNGSLPTRTADLNQQSTDLTTQISNLETKITNDSDQWNSEFQAMETAESQTNEELTYLSQGVTNGSL
jgi:flagellar hook-associated protein 2